MGQRTEDRGKPAHHTQAVTGETTSFDSSQMIKHTSSNGSIIDRPTGHYFLESDKSSTFDGTAFHFQQFA